MDYPVKHNLDDAQHKVAATQESQKPKIDDGQGAESVEKQGVFDCGQEAADLAMHRGGLEFPATQIMEQATQDFPNPEVESSQIKKPKIAEGQSELDQECPATQQLQKPDTEKADLTQHAGGPDYQVMHNLIDDTHQKFAATRESQKPKIAESLSELDPECPATQQLQKSKDTEKADLTQNPGGLDYPDMRNLDAVQQQVAATQDSQKLKMAESPSELDPECPARQQLQKPEDTEKADLTHNPSGVDYPVKHNLDDIQQKFAATHEGQKPQMAESPGELDPERRATQQLQKPDTEKADLTQNWP